MCKVKYICICKATCMFSYILEKVEKKKKEGRTEKIVEKKKEYRLFLVGEGGVATFHAVFLG